MASLDQISQALLNADAAGDTEAATALAQEYRKLSQTSAVAPTVAATIAPEKPFFDLSDTLSATGRAFTSLGTSVPASMRQAFGGLENPWQRSESYMQSRADMQALQEELNASEAAAMEGGDASSVSSSIREATPSLGFSGSTLVPSLAAGAVTALATKSPAAARSAAAGTSLLMAYRMAGAQFLDDSRERIDNFFQEKLQRPLTPEEQNEAYEELLPLARKFGAAEAGPEALGNMALGGAGKYIRKALGGKNGIMSLASNALSKVTGAKAVGAGIGAAAGEVGTEAITAVEQDRINKEFEQSVLRGEAPESVVLPDRTVQDYTKGITEVAPTTLAMTGLMGLAGLGPTALNRGYRALRPQAEQQAVETEITTEEPAPATPPAPKTPSQVIAENLATAAENTSNDANEAVAAAREVTQQVAATKYEPRQNLPTSDTTGQGAEIATEQRSADSNIQSVLPTQTVEGADRGGLQPLGPELLVRGGDEVVRGQQEVTPTVEPTVETPSVKDLVDAGMPQDEAAAERQAQLEATAPKRPLTDLTDEELEQRIQDSSRLANETAVEGSPDAAFFTNAAEKYRAEKARRVAATTQAATPAPTTPVELPVPTVAPTVETPSPAMEQIETPSQTLTGSNVQTSTEMPVPPPTAEAGAGVGEAPVSRPTSGRKPVLAPQAQEMLAQAAAINAGTQTVAPSTNEFVQKMTGQVAPPITPQGTPTPATEGTVMPGGSAMERDVTKPEQMTPEEYKANFGGRQDKMTGQPFEPDWVTYEDGDKKLGLWLAMRDRRSKLIGKKTGQEILELSGNDQVWVLQGAFREKSPVSAAAVDTYGIKLPQGYVKQGELYVFSPQTTTVATPTETAAPLAKEAAVASVVQQPAEGSIPAVEQQSAITAIESNEKADIADVVIQEVVDENTDLNPITDEMVDSSLSPVEKREAAIILGKKTWADSKALFKQRMADWMAGANETSKKLIKFFKTVANKARLLLAASIGLSMANSTSDVNLATSDQFRAFKIPVSSILNSKPARPQFGSLPDMSIGIPEQKIPLGLSNVELNKRPKIDTRGKKISSDAAKTAQWVLDTADSEGYPFIVTDKIGATMYFFDEKGVLLKKSPVLVGKNVGDFIGNTDAGRITPSGRFEIAPETDATYGNVFSVMGTDMVDSETGELVEVAIHRLALHDPSEKRPQRIATATPLDNRISWGCMNLDNKVMDWAFNNYPLGGLIYILPETAKGRSVFAPLNAANIESSKQLAKNSNVDLRDDLNRKEDKKLEAAQKKREELNLKTLNSLIQKTRTNVVQGTVNPTDANQAVAILNRSGEIPNVLFTWIGTSKDFLADPANRVRYPETWAAVSANSKIEGMSENGQPIVFTDNVGVSDLDRKLANLQGTTPEVAAVRRVILHENIHKGIFFLSMKEKMQIFSFLRRMYSPQELDSLAESYSEYSDWRTNQVSYFSILEEAMTRDFDSMVEIPRDGILAEFMQFLRGIWQKITGKTSEPTLKDYKDVFRLIRNSLKNSEKANADMLVNGGGVRMSMSEFLSNVTPEQDAEYMAAVESGDVAKQQAMVDAAAKAAGYDVSVFHGTGDILGNGRTVGGENFTEFKPSTMGALGPGIYVATDEGNATSYAKRFVNPRLIKGYAKITNPFKGGTVAEVGKKLFETFPSETDAGTIEKLQEAGFDAVWADKPESTKFGVVEPEINLLKPNQFKSADPVTRDKQGNVIPLSRRFQTASNDIRFSKVEYDSPNDAAFNSGAEVARNTDYDERDKEVRSTIRAAYDIAPKTNGPSVPLDELFSIVKQSMPDLTETEFSRILQGLYEDSGALLIEGEVVPSYTSEEEVRHAELESKFNAGTITEAETAEAQALVDAAAKAAGYNVGPIYRTNKTRRTVFDPQAGKTGPVVRFTGDKSYALLYGDVLTEAYLRINNPFILDETATFTERGKNYDLSQADVDAYKAKGYDGILIFPKKGFSKPDFNGLEEAIVFTSSQIKSADPFTGVPLNQRFDTGNDIRGNINIFTTEGERAGSVIVMPPSGFQTKAMASIVDSQATEDYRKEVDAANTGKAKAPFGGVQFTNFMPIDRAVKSAEEYSDAAIKYVNNLEKEGVSLDDIANSVISPAFLESIGIEQDLMAQDALTIEVRQRVDNAAREEKSPGRKKQLSKLSERLSAFWQGVGSKKGQHLGQRRYLVNKARYSWMFIREIAEKAMKEARTNILISNFGSENATSFTQNSYENSDKANQQAVDEIAQDVVNNEEWALIKEGEQVFEGARKTKWERVKALARRFAFYARRKAMKAANAKASLSDAERNELNAILQMSDEEADAAEAKDLAEFDKLMGDLLGEESSTDTPAEKVKRKKRKEIIDTVEKRVAEGQPIEPTAEEIANEIEIAENKASQIVYRFEELYRQGFKNPPEGMSKKEQKDSIIRAFRDQVKNPVSFEQFAERLDALKVGEEVSERLFLTASRERADLARMKKFKIEKRRVEIADKQASRLIYSTEERLRQGSKDLSKSTSGDSINKAFKDQVSDPVEKSKFAERLAKLDVSPDVAERLFKTAEREKTDLEAMAAFNILQGPKALQRMINEINNMRRGEEIPLRTPIPWRQLLSQSAKTVDEYRQRIFDAISANEELKNATPEQKARLAELFTEAWETKRKRILDSMQERLIREQEAKGNLSKEGAKALQAQRMRIVEDINLGIFDNDELAKRMAEKFGIKSEFTETEREKINSLIEVLQDEGLNAVKRQVAAYKLLEVLQGELKIPVAKMLADFWVSSVLSGPNTIVSIGLAVASGAFELSTALSRVFIAGFTNPKQLPSELAGAYKTLARLLSAYGRQANIAWQYLVSGDPVFLDPSMNDVTENMQWGNIGKSNKLAEQMAKSDKILVKSAGLFMRTVSRLLTALDVFNSGLTKEGSLSIVFRQIGLDPAKIAEMEKKSDLKPYKDAIIQQDFKNTPPKSARDKAILDSYALADMMKELDKLGNVSENANFFGQQGAMTLDPSGLGGVGYRAIRSLVTNAEAGADRFLKQAQRGWNDSAQNGDRILSGLELAFAYFMQFAAYNAANFGGVRFARFAGNKFNQGLSFIPGIGFARAFEAEFDPNRISGKEAFIDSIRRNQLIGVMLSVAGYQILKAIADEPDDEKRGWFINGGWGNLTPEKKQQKLAAGEKEYTIGINGKVFNYANWPISSALAAIGSLSDLIRFSPDQWNDKNVAQIMASAAMSGAAAAADIPALSQFQEIFGNSLSSKDPNEKRMERFAKVMSSYAGGFVPRFLKDIDYAQDPNLRKYETLWEKTASHIPVYRRYEGKEYYDILGQQIQRNVYPGSREFMVKPTDPAYKVLGALNSRGIWLTPANAEHRMVGKGARRRSLTQEEADNYSLETGKGYKQMLLRYGQRALQMPTERAKAFLLDKADEVRDRALKKVYRGYKPAT